MSIALIAHSEGNPTAGVDTTGANLLVCAVNRFNDTAKLTDSKSNTWTELTVLGTSDKVSLLYALGTPVVGAGHTFTSTAGSSWVYMEAFSGALAFDQESGANAAVQPGSITPAGDNELFVTGKNDYSSSVETIDSGFTISDGTGNFPSTYKGGMAYKIQTTGGAENPSWGFGSGFPVAMATFTSGGGGGGGGANILMGQAWL